MLTSRTKSFVHYYVKLFKVMSKLGLAPMDWSEDSSKFVKDKSSNLILSSIFYILIVIQFTFLSARMSFVIFFENSYNVEDVILLLASYTFNINSFTIYYFVFFRLDAGIESISGIITNLARLQGKRIFKSFFYINSDLLTDPNT